MKYLLRLLALPFFLGIHTIFTIGFLFKNAYNFMVYGGESMIFRAADRDTVHSMLQEIRDRQAKDLHHTNLQCEPNEPKPTLED